MTAVGAVRSTPGDAAVGRDGFLPAVLVFLSGVAFLAALTAYSVITYSESATACSSLLQPDLFGEQAAFCEPYQTARRGLVRSLAVVGAVLLVAGLLVAAVRRETGLTPRTGGAVKAALGGRCVLGFVAPVLLVPFGVIYGSVVNGATQESFGLPSGWLHLAAPLGTVIVCWWLSRHGLTRQSAMAAAAASLPAMSLIQFLPPLIVPYTDGDSSAEITYNGWFFLLSGISLVVALVAAALLQSRGRAAPGVTVSLALGLVSAALTTVVFLPQILPGYEGARGGGRFTSDGMQASLWVPLLTGMLLLAVAIIATTAARAEKHSLPHQAMRGAPQAPPMARWLRSHRQQQWDSPGRPD